MKNKIEQLREITENAEAIIIGAGAGLSTSAGFTYSGERFKKYFGDFIEKYHFRDMYEGGFYPFDSLEEHWAYWSRYIFINRYMDAPKPVYEKLLELVKDKDYFVLTTNVDHCFQKAGFAKEKLFYTQGDYGLFQCSKPCHRETYDNETIVRKMLEAQGFVISADSALIVPEGTIPQMTVTTELIPKCPVCGKPMTMNLRADASFVQDAGWDIHAGYYGKFLAAHEKSKLLFLELGVGYNTPGIIKYPFWQMTAENKNAEYVCINKGEISVPKEIKERAICISGDVGEVLAQL
ncbi:MAG: Sir2 silent information regulator family NAD-dependent deacetylase [Butyrivibrio sp.]|nr:Sir2 silent information regulator family NAD-dependent deacetylase [Acetatifactor muris]MCM1559299.1 Sir2 silent information regulator family NAD-dependent deacetylase [Butyrivibrio sp.]